MTAFKILCDKAKDLCAVLKPNTAQCRTAGGDSGGLPDHRSPEGSAAAVSSTFFSGKERSKGSSEG